ncbi:hypothetical protein JTB14_001118 [Gonioctena quinquepunctata]|nr:hypothetical protein JTB14_001118 [Gonioctena quinquepunctata]
MKIEFLKDSAEGSRNEVNDITERINQLQPFHAIVNEKEITVSYKLALTMYDGKVCNSLTSTAASQRCYLCNATSEESNDINKILKRKTN